jgi:serine/threonine protein kinase
MHDDVFRPGELCGTYRILKLLGRGGFADVYQAIDVGTQQKVALKCLQLRHLTNAQITQRMVAETELLAGLDHPNVVQVEDAGINGGVLWLAMEYISGGTLRERLRKARGPLPAAAALNYARQIAEGVGAAHSMKVVHRDLKPENIMITDKNEVKVLDLGAAKFFGKELTETGSKGAIGTPLYMAPEQIKGEVVDVRTDVYALGIILYEMLAGRHPFAQPTGDMPPAFEIGTLHLHARPKPLTDFVANLSADVCQIVERAISKDPSERFAGSGSSIPPRQGQRAIISRASAT